MNSLTKISLIILSLISTLNCSSGNRPYAWLEREALNNFGENHSVLFNSDSTFVVVANSSNEEHSNKGINSFIIFNVKNRNKIFEDNVVDAQIKWVKNHLLLITTFPGVESVKAEENRNSSYYLNVLTLKKTKV